MAQEHYEAIIRELEQLRTEVNSRIDTLHKDIKYEMSIKHQEFDFRIKTNEDRTNKYDKMIGWLAALVGSILISGLLYSLLK